VDWNLIKAEYIAGGISYRDLAKKYGVPFSTLSRTAIKENWVALKEQVENKVETDLVKSTAESESNRLIRIDSIADKILD
jgi:transposase-like protein